MPADCPEKGDACDVGWCEGEIQCLALLCAVPAATKVWTSGCPNGMQIQCLSEV